MMVHGNFKGNNVKPQSGRARAERKFELPDLCEECVSKPAVERHHKDGNPLNNERENIAFVCRACHMRLDGRIPDTPGVIWHQNRWQVQVRGTYLGRYETKEEAVRIADEYRKVCEDAILNA